ncbi:MAG TPA: hypothetical protein VEA79_06640 [Phenylobacterium sp.]|nr:hypothetical protein [Phenylobacterium sp.]
MTLAPRLRAYVRRTILEAARDYANAKRRTPESTKAAFMDAMRGTDTGWWNDLIYTADILDRFNRHRSEVRDAIRDFMGETGAGMADPAEHGHDAHTYADLIAATGRRQTWADYTSDDKARAREADAATLALRFAVEYLAGDLARTYAPDL